MELSQVYTAYVGGVAMFLLVAYLVFTFRHWRVLTGLGRLAVAFVLTATAGVVIAASVMIARSASA